MRRKFLIMGPILTAWLWAAGCVAVYPAMGSRSEPGLATARPEAPLPAEQTASADPDAEVARQADRWPARWGTPGSPRGVVVPVEHRLIDLRPAHLGRFHNLRTSETEYRHAEALARAVGKDDGFRFEAEGPGSLVYLPPAELPDPDAPVEPGDESFVVAFVSARELPASTPDDPRIAIERTWLAFYDAATPEPKGTIVIIPGMLGTPQPIIEGKIRFWRNNGYAVLRFLSHPSRFTERIEVPIPAGEEERVGRELADVYDQRTAECAFAADAALDYVFARRAGLKDKPVVLVGMSGGAMVLPTVYAYAPHRYHAGVLIAGGANFLKISALSNYADWIDAMVLDWEPDKPDSTGRATPERLERLTNGYLGASRLDATHTAPEMAAIPTLVLHATRDRAVPSDTGEVLWRLLDQPERWVFNVGHEVIFVMLPTQSGRMQTWIDRTLAEPRGEP